MKRSETGRVEAGFRNSGASEVDARIEELDDWRGAMLARLRAVIKQADPDVVEEFKWKKPSKPLRGACVVALSSMLRSTISK
jgi:hypothetical protein